MKKFVQFKTDGTWLELPVGENIEQEDGVISYWAVDMASPETLAHISNIFELEVPETEPTKYETVIEVSYEIVSDVLVRRKDVIGLKDPETVRAMLFDELAEIRWNRERSGMTFNGMLIPTDDGTKANLTAAYTKARLDPDRVRQWKVGPGQFVPITGHAIIAMGDAFEDHIQACFDREAEISAMLLEAEHSDDLLLIREDEFESGWPS